MSAVREHAVQAPNPTRDNIRIRSGFATSGLFLSLCVRNLNSKNIRLSCPHSHPTLLHPIPYIPRPPLSPLCPPPPKKHRQAPHSLRPVSAFQKVSQTNTMVSPKLGLRSCS